MLGARLVLVAAMALSAALILWLGRGTGFTGDDLFYYARLVNRGIGVDHYHHLSLEYLLAPHNNHMQLVGKLIYEGLFATAGPSYVWYRLVEVVGVLLCVGLFFELAQVRIGPWAALAPAILLLFYGYAWETLLWPFDLHTVYALAAGLGALLCLDRPGRRSDLGACFLLLVSVATFELGLAFVVAIAVLIGLQRRPWRLWIVATPAVLYGAWYLWARQFHQPAYHATSPLDLGRTIGEASGAVLGSLLAVNPVGDSTSISTVGTAGWPILSVLTAAALLVAIWRGPNRPWLWSLLSLVLTYWLFLALAGRLPDSSRYVFAGSLALLLLGAEALHGRHLPLLLVGGLFLVLVAVMPRNIKLLSEARTAKVEETRVNRVDAGAEQLAADQVNPDYSPARDPLAVARGGAGLAAITAGQYLSGAARVGFFGYSPSQLLALPPGLRDLADAVMVDSGGLRVSRAPPAAAANGCRQIRPNQVGGWAPFAIPPAGVLVGPAGRPDVRILARGFGPSGVTLTALSTPIRIDPSTVSALPKWQGLADGPALVCQ